MIKILTSNQYPSRLQRAWASTILSVSNSKLQFSFIESFSITLQSYTSETNSLYLIKKIDMIYKSKHLIITCVHVIVNTSTVNKSNYVPKWITFTGSSIKPPFLSYEKPDVVFKRTTAGISRSGTKPEICSPLKRKKTRPHARNRGKVSTSSVSKKHAAVGFQLRPHFLQRRRARRLIWGQLRRASQGGYVWLECVKQLFQALGAEKP